MTKVLVTGASGQLGREFRSLENRDKKIQFVYWSRSDVDITDPEIGKKITAVRPDWLINCAAYTAVDLAETNKKIAFEINANAVKKLGKAANQLKIPMVHFSTDYVYHNSLRRPLTEEDPLRPKGIYAKSKLKGEKILLEVHPNPIIFRVSWLYSSHGKNFPKTIMGLCASRDELNVVSDQWGSPTYARDLASTVLSIVMRDLSPGDLMEIRGVYNYCNLGQTHWAEIAEFIVSYCNQGCKINRIKSVQYPTPAPRPRNSQLNLTKFNRTFGIPIPHWKESLSKCLDLLQNESA